MASRKGTDGDRAYGRPADLRRHRCTATSKQSGKRCGNYAMPGTNVCHMHGAKAPQVKRKARLRLLELVDPAIATLARIMVSGENDRDKLRAVENVLDRVGFSRSARIEVEDAREMLVDRLMTLADDDRG